MPQTNDDHRRQMGRQDDGCRRQQGQRARFAPPQQRPRQRREDVVPCPIAKGDVPALPEGGDIAAGVGPVEVLRQTNAEEDAQADGDIAVAAEIELAVQARHRLVGDELQRMLLVRHIDRRPHRSHQP